MRRNEDNLIGLRWIVSGFIIIAFVILSLQVVRIFKVWNIAEFAAIFAVFLSWILVFWGATLLMQSSKSWKKMWILSIAVPILVVAEGLVAFRNVRNGMMEQAFIDIAVMFFFYLTLLGLFYGYRRMLKGMAAIVKKSDALLARKCMKAWLPSCGIVMITLIMIPITGMFPRIVQYIGTGILGMIGLLAQLYMCKLLMDGYQMTMGKVKEKVRE